MIVFSTHELIVLAHLAGEEPRMALPAAAAEPADWVAVRDGLLARGVLVPGAEDGDPAISATLQPLLGVVTLAPRVSTFTRIDARGVELVQFLRAGDAVVRHHLVDEDQHAFSAVEGATIQEQFDELVQGDPVDPAEPPHRDLAQLVEDGATVVTISDQRFDGDVATIGATVIVDLPGEGRWAADGLAGDVAAALTVVSTPALRDAILGALASDELEVMAA